jgi:AraC-like DNA-binding protein
VENVYDSGIRDRHRIRDVADAVHIRLFTVDALTLGAHRWNTRDVQSPYWRFYQNRDDGGYLDLPDGSHFPLQAERAYFVPAGVRFSCANTASFRHFYVHFDVIGLPRLTMRDLFDGPVALPEARAFEEHVATFASEVAASPTLDIAGQCRAKALVYEGFARCLSALPAKLRERGLRRAEALEPVAPAIDHIETHLGSPLPVPMLAALCFQSPDHFARRFRYCVGQTPGAYIRERRVARAAQMLLFTESSLDEIALLCGFGNRSYLTRIFTRAMEAPPATYRRTGRPYG